MIAPMSNAPWLLLDCNYLAYRAFHAYGRLSHDDIPTGVVYGFMRDLLTLQDRFATDRLAFCWDFGKPLRCREYQKYKEDRRNKVYTPEELEDYILLRSQIRLLRSQYLPSLGHKNNFYQHGYEADDVIASLVKQSLPPRTDTIIISADHDLFQLLGRYVTMYNPHRKELMTEQLLREQYGVSPTAWVEVKAIAGCSSDNIQGIKGVGEKTAAAFLGGRLKETTKAYQAITQGNRIWRRNLKLVELPLYGVKKFKLREDDVSTAAWQALVDRLGFESLRNRF